jgi:hypothetical protein
LAAEAASTDFGRARVRVTLLTSAGRVSHQPRRTLGRSVVWWRRPACARSASIAATDSRSRRDPLARCALFVPFEGMGLLDLTGPLTVFGTVNPLAP